MRPALGGLCRLFPDVPSAPYAPVSRWLLRFVWLCPVSRPFSQPVLLLVLKYPPSDVCFLLTVRFSVNALREVAMSHQCVGCHVAFACVALTDTWCLASVSLPPLSCLFLPCPWKLSSMLILPAMLLAPTTVTAVQAFNLLEAWP